MIKLEDFRSDLIQEARIETQQSGQGDAASYIEKVIAFYNQNGFMQDYTPCYFAKQVKNNAEIKLDGFATDEIEEALYIVVGMYYGNTEFIPRITQSDLKIAIERASRFLTNTLSNSSISFCENYLEIGK
ncbi:MAG: hypothetical protein HUJ61_02840, partial [Bacilli bacterium]|nr:hypothetical protein [Bacilli bacterium]